MYLTIFGGKYSINSLHLLTISLLEKEGCIYMCVYMSRRPRQLGLMLKIFYWELTSSLSNNKATRIPIFLSLITLGKIESVKIVMSVVTYKELDIFSLFLICRDF